MFRGTLLLCPACSCHAKLEDASCPHCGASLRRSAGGAAPRSAAALACGLALAVGVPVLGGCSDDAQIAGSSNGAGGGGGAGGQPAVTSGQGGSGGWQDPATTHAVTHAANNAAMSTYGAPPTCDDVELDLELPPDEQSCFEDLCCSEIRNCVDVDEDACNACLRAGGGALCDDALECLEYACLGNICDSGLTTSDIEIDACLGRNCCDAYNLCTGNGVDPQACIDCLDEGGGPLCDEALACRAVSCGVDWCSAGITTGNEADPTCVVAYCCGELLDCHADGRDVEGCTACLDAGGGAACDALLACEAESCGDGAGGGGGGGATGVGGSGGAGGG